LRWFGQKQGDAKKAFGSYVAEGIDQGRRPELVSGWSTVKAMRLLGDRELSDDRIIGSGEFGNLNLVDPGILYFIIF
jgi:putative transposase